MTDVGAMYTKPMVECSVELYHRVCQDLLPTPSRSHYTFNLRDVSKVFQGITSIRPGSCLEPRRWVGVWVGGCMGERLGGWTACVYSSDLYAPSVVPQLTCVCCSLHHMLSSGMVRQDQTSQPGWRAAVPTSSISCA